MPSEKKNRFNTAAKLSINTKLIKGTVFQSYVGESRGKHPSHGAMEIKECVRQLQLFPFQ